MKVISLVENHTCREDCGCTHGLSLYIDTDLHRIVFDVGPDDLCLRNAAALGLDLKTVDTVVISHGHYDHASGLEAFCKTNRGSTIYMRKNAFGPYYAQNGELHSFIGPDDGVLEKFGIRFNHFEGELEPGFVLFANPETQDYLPSACRLLQVKEGEEYRPDPFDHEQSLLLTVDGKRYLFVGCAHRGIVNILRQAETLADGPIDYVFAGFHLTNPTAQVDEPRELIEAVGRELLSRPNTKYYTGHCTGDGPFAILKEMLGDRLEDLPAGKEMDFGGPAHEDEELL